MSSPQALLHKRVSLAFSSRLRWTASHTKTRIKRRQHELPHTSSRNIHISTTSHSKNTSKTSFIPPTRRNITFTSQPHNHFSKSSSLTSPIPSTTSSIQSHPRLSSSTRYFSSGASSPYSSKPPTISSHIPQPSHSTLQHASSSLSTPSFQTLSSVATQSTLFSKVAVPVVGAAAGSGFYLSVLNDQGHAVIQNRHVNLMEQTSNVLGLKDKSHLVVVKYDPNTEQIISITQESPDGIAHPLSTEDNASPPSLSSTETESIENVVTPLHAPPPVIGAPPAEFNHPYDLTHNRFYKFFHACRRSVVIFFTFLPFIRYYTMTHFFRQPSPQERHEMLEKLVSCLEQSGCAFIKFGQWLSMRPDIFSLDIIEALSRLRDGAPSHSFEQTAQIIQEEFGCPIEELFEHFSHDAVASGSVAQVYKARLRPEIAKQMNIINADGSLVRDVAVKIRHPGVLSETWTDLDIIYAVVDRIPALCIPFNKEELKLMIQYQIDFRFEGHYLSRFRHNFFEEIQQGYIAFPYVSEGSLRQSVLIESWAQGKTVGEIFTEVGDLFRPLLRLDKPQTNQTIQNEPWDRRLKKRFHSVTSMLKDMSSDLLYFLADKYDIKLDSYNGIKNSNNDTIDDSFIANFLRQLLPPRGRIGEEKYIWNDTLTAEENQRAKQKKVLAYTLFDMFIKMFLRDNLIHADLHAGNVLYDAFGLKHTATVLDAGMTVALEDDIMKQFELFLRAICDGDADSLVEAVSRFEVNLPNSHDLTILPPLPNSSSDIWERLAVPSGSGIGHLSTNALVRNRFHYDVHQVCKRFYASNSIVDSTNENVSIGDVVGQVLLVMQKHGIVLRGDVAASIMAMSVIEGLLRQLDPDLDIIVKTIPYFFRYKGMDRLYSR